MTENKSQCLPSESQKGIFLEHPAVKTPWEKLISFHDTHHYVGRHISTVAATFMQVLRILIPDYKERATALIKTNNPRYRDLFMIPEYRAVYKGQHNFPPFVKGTMIGALAGDEGDEANLMAGRVVDYGTYRFEKELDTCPWDIVGSELCRTTLSYFEALCNTFGEPHMEFNMVEAKGCGDLHCRIVAENREKYPMPPRKEIYEAFGPVATADQIKFTPEDQCYKEPQFYRPDSDGKYRSGFCAEWSTADQYLVITAQSLGSNDVVATINDYEPDRTKAEHVTKCVFEAAGKMTFSEFTSVKGMRDWLGVPGDVNDGRVLGGLIEVELQAMMVSYNVAAFDEKEVVIDINKDGLERGGLGYDMSLITVAYLSLWNGMSKTLIGSQWSAWRETDGVPEGTVRVKISKKIDKFC
jgi:hypothetical protein